MEQADFDALKAKVDDQAMIIAEQSKAIETLIQRVADAEQKFEAFLDEYNPFRIRAEKIANIYFTGINDQ